MSYDGRNKEPITLPVKFPLLLAQGAEGIAVGLSSKILPHNFCEICDAAIAYLHEQPFQLFPDFPTAGSIDVSKYNDGQRGGVLKVRAKIEKIDQKTLVIREIPFSKTSETLQDSIVKAIEKGKIKARKVEDLTAASVEIQIHLAPGVSSDKTIDALFAFTDCEINISPNCCVIEDNKPQFLTISDVLRHSVDRTKDLIRQELEIRKNELLEQAAREFCGIAEGEMRVSDLAGLTELYVYGDRYSLRSYEAVIGEENTGSIEDLSDLAFFTHLEKLVLAFQPLRSLETMPACVYTAPEIASVGLTAEQAKELGIAAESHKVPMSANGKTVVCGAERGFIKVIYGAEDHKLLGAQMMCERATDMISEFALGITKGLTMEEMARVVRPHPTFSEAITEVVRV